MKTLLRAKRHARVRSHVSGTTERPRLVIFRGARSLSLQLVNDAEQRIVLTVATKRPDGPVTVGSAAALGARLAKEAKAKKITAAVFDRAGYRYHGRVKAAVDAARQEGMTV